MPSLKDILVKQAGVPGNIEKNLPLNAPKVSQLMVNIAAALPVNPNLPELPLDSRGFSQTSEATVGPIRGIEEPISLNPNTKVEITPATPTLDISLKPLGEEILS